MVITVAICTWNRCQLLRKTLEQFTQVTIPPDVEVDLLVVNNNCTDDTPTVVDAFRHRLPVRTLLEPAPGLSHARNAALSASSSDYIVFTDDDVLVDKSWLVELVAAARVYPTAAVIGGVIEPWFPVEPDAEFQEVFPWLKGGFCGLNHGAERALLPTGRFVYGANMAFRMDRVAGMRFSPQLGTSPTSAVGGEEREFMARLQASGESIVWWPQMIVQHYVEPQRMLLPYLLAFSAGKGKEWVFFRGGTGHRDGSACLGGYGDDVCVRAWRVPRRTSCRMRARRRGTISQVSSDAI